MVGSMLIMQLTNSATATSIESFHVLRFWNNDVLKNTDGVLEVILTALETAPSPGRRAHPLLKGEGKRASAVRVES